MGISAGLGPKMLRDTLVSDQRINSEESRPVLNLSKQDLESLMAGKKASKKFLDQNRKELQRYLNQAVKSEESMLGYLEVSNMTKNAEATTISLDDQESII